MNHVQPAIRIAVIGNVPSQLIRLLEQGLEAVFGVRVGRHQPGFSERIAFDAARQQYDSTVLLSALHEERPQDDCRIIGVADLDLFIPVFTFVFGEAQLRGRVAVASLYRLRDSFYGLPDDPDRTMERLLKECVHELGHTYGLVHCSSASCVMSASPGVEEVDIKNANFCPRCARAIQETKVMLS